MRTHRNEEHFAKAKIRVIDAFEDGSLYKLPADERRVLMFRYMCEMRLEDVAKRMGWESHSAACNAQRSGLRKLGTI